MGKHHFGGDWTQEKLERIRKYLQAYVRIFHSNERARYFKTIYLDAFAGTGWIDRPMEGSEQKFLGEHTDPELASLKKGSARIALDVTPPFDQYVFIERNPERLADLRRLQADFAPKADRISIIGADANAYLQQWCSATNWRTHRAVLFLDPYGMQVDWPTVEAIAQTQAIDLWLLFPLGVAINRLLPRSEPPTGPWADALTRFFGTTDWKNEFYPARQEQTLFGPDFALRKDTDFEHIGKYFVNRLKSIFPAVAGNPLALRNSVNTPLYLLCFAAGNPTKASTAVRIATDILED